jgi:hypothetical protein
MKSHVLVSFVIAAALALGGCAFVPKTNLRLEEARDLYRAAQSDERLAQLAPREMEQAAETFHLADSAWNTLDDAAVVDHLAYVAKQRLAIARETARRSTAERSVLSARLQHAVSLMSEPDAPISRLAGDPR